MNKKILIGIALMLPMAVSLQAQAAAPEKEGAAQAIRLTGGAVLEANITNFIHSGIDDGRSGMRLGGSAGAFLNMGLSSPFSIQGEMLFHYKTSDFAWDGRVGRYQYWGVEIPIYAIYSWNIGGNGLLHIGIGPYTNFGLSAKFKEGGKKMDVYEKEAEGGLPVMKDSDTGFGVKLGYEFASGLQLNMTYKISVTNIIDANSSMVAMRPQTVAFGIAYRWGKLR